MGSLSLFLLLQFFGLGIWLGRGRRRLSLSTAGIVFLYLVIFHIGAGLWLVFDPPEAPTVTESMQPNSNTN